VKARSYYCCVLNVRRVPARKGLFFLPIDRPFIASYLACVSRFPARMTITIGRRTLFHGDVPQRPIPLLTPAHIRRGSVLTVRLANQLHTRRWNRVQLTLNGSISL
jgi:hypothetical protein